ncbi:MAG TPA: hypothetical protein VNR63_07945 [Gaiellaceae bacterium]|jgi:hypothetical protein|nr:hypothetical protein [Gaiellaceae bacterium]
MASCETCGGRLPKDSRYCPQCGQPVGDGGTKVLDVPPDETGPVPVEYMHAERSYYGVTPTTLVAVLAVVAMAAAVILFALGHWPFGLIVLGVALLLVLVVVETGALRDRAGVAAETVATRGRAARRLLGVRRELRHIAAVRARSLYELGEAVYRGDEQATEAARRRVAELDERARQREAEMQTVIAQAQERIHSRRLEVAPTEMVEIPDPQPPPEQDPSGPAVIPEPYPPPDEGNPPEPAVIPEPGPLAPEEQAK